MSQRSGEDAAGDKQHRERQRTRSGERVARKRDQAARAAQAAQQEHAFRLGRVLRAAGAVSFAFYGRAEFLAEDSGRRLGRTCS